MFVTFNWQFFLIYLFSPFGKQKKFEVFIKEKEILVKEKETIVKHTEELSTEKQILLKQVEDLKREKQILEFKSSMYVICY